MAKWTAYRLMIGSLVIGVFVCGFTLVREGKREKETVVATPSPPGVFSHPTVAVERGQRICIAPFSIPGDADQGQLILAGGDRPSRLRAEVTSGSRRARAVLETPAQAGVVSYARFPLPDTRSGATARFCARNSGPGTARLLGTDEGRFQTFTRTAVDGKQSPVTATMVLVDSTPHSLFARVDDAVGDVSRLTGGVPKALLWLLVALVVIGIPAATVTAVVSSDPER